MHKLVMVGFIFLSACGEGSDKNKGNKGVNQPSQHSKGDLPTDGSELFSKYGCFACHSIDGSDMYGPPLNDLFMKEVSMVR